MMVHLGIAAKLLTMAALTGVMALGCAPQGSTSTPANPMPSLSLPSLPESGGLGRLVLRIKWPERDVGARYIPVYAESVVFDLKLKSNAKLGAQLIADRPASGATSMTMRAAYVPAGEYTYTVNATAGRNGTGTAVATGAGTVAVTANQDVSVSVTLQGTVTSLAVLEQPVQLPVGASAQLEWSATDTQGSTVAIPPSALTWSVAGGSAYASVSSYGVVTGLAAGTATISVEEPNVSVSAQATVNVGGAISGPAWPHYRGDRRNTGRSLYTGAQTNTFKWEYYMGYNMGVSPAVAADGTVYIANDGYVLHAVDPTGAKKWEFTAGVYTQWGVPNPAIGPDGTVYMGSNTDKLYAINPDGTKKWEFATGAEVGVQGSGPVVGGDGTIYFSCLDHKVYAVKSDGTKKWEFMTGDFISATPALAPDGTVYAGGMDRRFYAINPDGSKKWEYYVASYVSSAAAIAPDGTIYVVARDGKLYAFTPGGAQKWSVKIGDWVRSSPAIGVDGTVYVGSDESKLCAINPDGSTKWTFQTTGWRSGSSPTIGSDGTIYVGSSDAYLYAINPDGTKKWDYYTGGNVRSTPAIAADGTVYVGSDSGSLQAIGP